MSATSNPQPTEPATYRVSEAAARAGVSKRTIWRWLDGGKLPGVLRQGKVVRISRKSFELWLESGGK